eukprot:351971-Chlamydomonas_euryale.AAC.7
MQTLNGRYGDRSQAATDWAVKSRQAWASRAWQLETQASRGQRQTAGEWASQQQPCHASRLKVSSAVCSKPHCLRLKAPNPSRVVPQSKLSQLRRKLNPFPQPTTASTRLTPLRRC